ncbi:hypothetical protein NS303_04535 [Pantoea ananatis]|uniref:DUF3383 family protein n=3 Tax=Pantoea ananas TaxID=553 RepID=UPI0007378443|nr:DUF3383 family protein [Pantoea ananatis]KTR49344.1 hypothetical protein NS303_04535 [Pantoea ananatis]KTR65487.1 hypothetical protein RSA47_05445 [Pantoea ananatis]KTR69718.1 hypothetical protein NS296_13980 [Pantoea ananatis]
MPQGLPVSNVASVDIIMSPRAAAGRNFGSLLILGSATIIPLTERIRLYTSAASIGTDFGTNSEEYLAAVAYFSQSPTPSQVYVGRWAKTLAAAEVGKVETLLDGVNACLGFTSWYGLGVTYDADRKDDDLLPVCAAIESSSLSRILAVTTKNTDALLTAVNTDIASKVKAAKYSRTFVQYSSTSNYGAISAFGRAFTVDFNGFGTTITLKFKQEPGITYESLTPAQAAALDGKNCNVYVYYANDTAILQQGVMGNGDFFDERHGLDWLQNYVQTNLFNLLYTSGTKVPQTDAGNTRIMANVEASMDQAIDNGLIAPGVWNGGAVGQLSPGDTLTKGYYVYMAAISSQAQADREARKSVPVQVACKLAGAIHYASVQINVMR